MTQRTMCDFNYDSKDYVLNYESKAVCVILLNICLDYDPKAKCVILWNIVLNYDSKAVCVIFMYSCFPNSAKNAAKNNGNVWLGHEDGQGIYVSSHE